MTPLLTAATRPVALLAHQVRFDLRASLRDSRARFATLILPVILLVILTGVFGHGHTTLDGHRVALSRFYVPGILAMSVVVCAYANLVIAFTTRRETGVLKRRRATPVPPWVLIGGQAVATLMLALAMSAGLLVLAGVAYGVGVSATGLAAIALIVCVASLALTGLAAAVSGLLDSPEAAQPAVQATTLPLWFLSGVFVPVSQLSPALRTVGRLFPVEHLSAALARACETGTLAAGDLLIVAAWGLAAAAVAAWRFSWMPSVAAT